MKFNWGHGLAVFIILFVLLMGLMIFRASKQQIDLVTEDYYPKELNYQNNIDMLKRTKGLEEDLSWKISNNQIQVKLPDTLANNFIRGKYLLYRPSDKRLDISDTIILDSSLTFYITSRKLHKGMYNLQVSLMVNDKESYLFKKDVHLE